MLGPRLAATGQFPQSRKAKAEERDSPASTPLPTLRGECQQKFAEHMGECSEASVLIPHVLWSLRFTTGTVWRPFPVSPWLVVRDALCDLKTPISGIVTTYNKPFNATNHIALKKSDVGLGVVKQGRVHPATQ